MLTTVCNELRMLEDDIISFFSGKLLDIANKAFQVGEEYPEVKLVPKALRSLPTRFPAKIAGMEEVNNITKLTLDDLLESLTTYDIKMITQTKDKGLALKVGVSASNYTVYSEDEIMMLT